MEPKIITPAEVARLLAVRAEVFIVDVRESREYHAGHIEDAISLPADTFADRYDRDLDSEDEVILICQRGLTADAAARFLMEQGFTKVSVMAGGMNAWKDALTTH